MTYVRRAIEADLDALLPLCRQFHAESPHHSRLRFSEARVAELILAALANPDWLALVACDDDGTIIGMGLFYFALAFFSDEGEVGDLTFWVAPEHRGGRAAVLMLKDLEGWVKLKRAKRLSIGVTTGINEAQAARFFARFGFERHGILLVK